MPSQPKCGPDFALGRAVLLCFALQRDDRIGQIVFQRSGIYPNVFIEPRANKATWSPFDQYREKRGAVFAVTASDATSIRVLSLDSALDRRDRVERMFADMKITNWRFFSALPPTDFNFSYASDVARQHFGRDLTPGELSCFASHFSMIEAFSADDSAEYAIFMEDDIVLDPLFDFGAVSKIMNLCGLDYLKMYARFYVPARLLGQVGRFSVYRAGWEPLGTQIYALSKAGARKLVSYICSQPSIGDPIDVVMDNFMASGVPPYLLYPFPALELNVRSSTAAPIDIQADDEKPGRNSLLRSISRRAGAVKKRLLRRLAEFRLRSSDRRVTQSILRNRESLRGLLAPRLPAGSPLVDRPTEPNQILDQRCEAETGLPVGQGGEGHEHLAARRTVA